MMAIKHFGLTTAAAIIFTSAANPALTAVNTDADALTKVALVTLEKSAYEAWKSKDSKFWDTFLSDNFVGWGSSGRLDKILATKQYTGADCEIKSYALSDEQMSPLDKGAALLTHKITVNGTCGGLKIPTNSWAAGVFVRDGYQWKAAFHAEAAIVDPGEAQVNPLDQETRKEDYVKSAPQDARTAAMLAAERAVWEAWKDHDAKRLEDLTARNISFINIFGTHLASKVDALKNWSGAGCNVKSVGVNDGVGTMLSPAVGILTFKATADGTCYGQNVPPVWGTSVYVKRGNIWKWTFGINLPARREGV
ncbi:MAG: nuclear transport factor 2 family protein [Pseudomonadota bacterium]|nr:nuclear transport factor 2 family protein [Pseudomonadota bacterium]